MSHSLSVFRLNVTAFELGLAEYIVVQLTKMGEDREEWRECGGTRIALIVHLAAGRDPSMAAVGPLRTRKFIST